MTREKLYAWVSVASMIASLIGFFDLFVLNQAISKGQFLPEQIPTKYFLTTVLVLCALIFQLSSRKNPATDHRQTESLVSSQEKDDALEAALNEVNDLKAKITKFEAQRDRKDTLADEIHGILATGYKNKQQLIAELMIDPDDKVVIGYLNATLGKLTNDNVIRGGISGYERNKRL